MQCVLVWPHILVTLLITHIQGVSWTKEKSTASGAQSKGKNCSLPSCHLRPLNLVLKL